MSISVLLVDDDAIICESLKIILSMNDDMNIIGTCKNGFEAVTLCSKTNVDVVLMDIRMPLCNGVEGTRLIKEINSRIKIIILTTFDDEEYIVSAIKNGASGYLLKSTHPDDIAQAIRSVHKGKMLLDNDISQKLANLINSEKKVDMNAFGLTASEQGIIEHISEGLSNKEIAEKLYFSEGTVKNKISDILIKLGLRDRTQIAIFYLKGGLHNKQSD